MIKRVSRIACLNYRRWGVLILLLPTLPKMAPISTRQSQETLSCSLPTVLDDTTRRERDSNTEQRAAKKRKVAKEKRTWRENKFMQLSADIPFPCENVAKYTLCSFQNNSAESSFVFGSHCLRLNTRSSGSGECIITSASKFKEEDKWQRVFCTLPEGLRVDIRGMEERLRELVTVAQGTGKTKYTNAKLHSALNEKGELRISPSASGNKAPTVVLDLANQENACGSFNDLHEGDSIVLEAEVWGAYVTETMYGFSFRPTMVIVKKAASRDLEEGEVSPVECTFGGV